MTVYCIMGCVMFDASVVTCMVTSMVTCMTGWFQTEFEIISLAILNNFLTAIFTYFNTVLVWNVYCNYCYYCLMWKTIIVTAGNYIHVL